MNSAHIKLLLDFENKAIHFDSMSATKVRLGMELQKWKLITVEQDGMAVITDRGQHIIALFEEILNDEVEYLEGKQE